MTSAEWITAIFGGSGILASIAGGVKFVWCKLESRFTAIEAQLEECRKTEVVSQERRAVLITVIELLWQEVQAVAPNSAILRRAQKLMDDFKAL